MYREAPPGARDTERGEVKGGTPPMTTVSVSPAMQAKAEALALQVPLLSRGRSKATGEAFVIVPGSEPNVAHYTTAYGCTCAGFKRRGVCTHQLAVSIADRTARQVPGAEHQPTASPTSWRPCVRKCGALLPPETRNRYCDPCYTRLSAVLDAA